MSKKKRKQKLVPIAQINPERIGGRSMMRWRGVRKTPVFSSADEMVAERDKLVNEFIRLKARAQHKAKSKIFAEYFPNEAKWQEHENV